MLGASGIIGMAPQLLYSQSIDKNVKLKGFVSHPANQETYLIAGRQAPVTLLVNKSVHKVNSISFCKEIIVSDDFIPVHKHGGEEELIYIQSGNGQFILGDNAIEVGSGSIAFVPRNEWHGLKNISSEPLIMLFNYSPAGFENYFREIGVPIGTKWEDKTPEEFAKIDKKYKIEYKFNPPRWE